MSDFYQLYLALIARGELKPDPDQDACAQRLSQMQEELEAVPVRGSVLWRAFGKKPLTPRGIYMWGGVGRGKSMLMDIFYDNLDINRKKRVHSCAAQCRAQKGNGRPGSTSSGGTGQRSAAARL